MKTASHDFVALKKIILTYTAYAASDFLARALSCLAVLIFKHQLKHA